MTTTMSVFLVDRYHTACHRDRPMLVDSEVLEAVGQRIEKVKIARMARCGGGGSGKGGAMEGDEDEEGVGGGGGIGGGSGSGENDGVCYKRWKPTILRLVVQPRGMLRQVGHC